MLNNILSDEEQALFQKIVDEGSAFVITCHQHPDGDAIGSSLGLAEYLRTQEKDVVVIVPDQYPDFLTWLPNTEKIVRYDKHKEQADLLIRAADVIFCLDYNTASRTAQMEESLLASKAQKIMIDHHLAPDMPVALLVSRPEASSTSELVFRLIWQLGDFGTQTKKFAVPIYCGMMTDTGGFTYNSSDPDIFFIVSQLLTKGINKDKIYRNVFHTFSENRLRLVGYVLLEKMIVDQQRHAAYFTLSRQDLRRFHFMKGDAEGLVNMPLQMKGLKLSVSLREDTEKDNLVWVSLRSVDTFPCNQMAEEFFNGGGHLNASGGRLMCSLADAVKVVQQAILHYENLLK